MGRRRLLFLVLLSSLFACRDAKYVLISSPSDFAGATITVNSENKAIFRDFKGRSSSCDLRVPNAPCTFIVSRDGETVFQFEYDFTAVGEVYIIIDCNNEGELEAIVTS